MRIDVEKFLLMGPVEAKESFFAACQQVGLMEFIDPSKVKSLELSEELQTIAKAHQILQALPVVEQEEEEDLSKAAAIAATIVQLKSREEKLLEERRLLRQEKSRFAPFGNFSLEELQALEEETGFTMQLFCAKEAEADSLAEIPALFLVGHAHGMDYYFSFQEEPFEGEGLFEMRPEQSLASMDSRLEKIEEELEDDDRLIKELARFDTLLNDAFLAGLNGYHLEASKSRSRNQLDGNLFSVTAWIPVDRKKELAKILSKHPVHAEQVAIEEGERVPTHLVNKGVTRIGEDLVNIYDTPGIEDTDPSPWVLWSFALFFAIIVGDGGYGLLFLLLGFWLSHKFPDAKGGGARAIRLTKILGFSCMVWGFITASFFGLNLPHESWWRQNSLLHSLAEKKANYILVEKGSSLLEWQSKFPALGTAKSGGEALALASTTDEGKVTYVMQDEFYDNILMEVALLIGVLHVCLGLLRYLRRSWANIGWVLFLVGGYLWAPSYLEAVSLVHFTLGFDSVAAAEAGKHLMIGGFSLAMVLSIVQNGLMGTLEVANLIQVFADVLSYLRLYALALAGGIVSATVNEISGSIAFVFGALLTLAGHAVNIVLSVMGGVIHGLRLNFIEWYHYCFDGGGKAFDPLKLENIE